MVSEAQHLRFPELDESRADTLAALGRQDEEHVHERDGVPEVVEAKPADRRTILSSDEYLPTEHLGFHVSDV